MEEVTLTQEQLEALTEGGAGVYYTYGEDDEADAGGEEQDFIISFLLLIGTASADSSYHVNP